jgi:hypothetical protein
VVDEVERAKNRTKSKVRTKVEHAIGVIKRVFGFVKVRYCGLEKNGHRLFVMKASAYSEAALIPRLASFGGCGEELCLVWGSLLFPAYTSSQATSRIKPSANTNTVTRSPSENDLQS